MGCDPPPLPISRANTDSKKVYFFHDNPPPQQQQQQKHEIRSLLDLSATAAGNYTAG